MEHLSAGDLLRAEREKGSENGVLIDTLIKEGKIVPVEITVELIREAMAASKCNRFLIDGFPRNEDNVNGWEKKMGTEAVVERVIFIECAEAELERRLMHRGLTSGRSDDNLETIRKRFGTFYESTMPIIKYFENLDKVVTVQGDNTREQVFSELSEALIPYMKEEILDLNLQLLQAASSADWQTYSALCYEKITGIAPECEEAMTGLEALQASFQSEACAGISAMNEPAVHVMGISAVVSYKREFSTSDGVIRQCNESRVWQQVDGQWKNVHFHRSAIEEQ
jgi:UMP-CMP kinase